ncbi:hypothetical protein [Luteimonas kalidii]|uniref:Uncharacterized protein n=1 Tax=Luteimonas kalidii TaxID=3042025 RepID=A0ABT6JVD7_9GAMM|nr:hypothetical protein [Luteimonas kalidii]MDH5834465.1 hypothetical protein [Luteimonas kalidii]
MSLHALLADVHPAWYADRSGHVFDEALIARARDSALGRRLLVRAMPQDLLDGLLAPRPGEPGWVATPRRWPRARVRALVRDLGVLAYAPLIRAEVRREPVRWLRATLGNSYLLALDRTVWDGRVDAATRARLSADWETLLANPAFLSDPAPLSDLLDRQGLAELQAWAARRNRALADWSRLLHPPAAPRPAHVPEKAVLVVASHHEDRDAD